ncbi:MAG: hypothetical protein WC054_14785 [Candidatus Nanopelagicales bacterium]
MEGVDHTEVLQPIPRGRLVWRLLAERSILRGRRIKVDCDSDGTPLQLRFAGADDRTSTLVVPLGEPGSVQLIYVRMPPSEVAVDTDVEAWLIPASPQGEVLAREWIPAAYTSKHIRPIDSRNLWWDLDHVERVLAPAGVTIGKDVAPLARGAFDLQVADGLEINSHRSPLVRGSFYLNLWIVTGFIVMWICALWSMTAALMIFLLLLFPVACVALISWIAYVTGWLETDVGGSSDSRPEDSPPWATKLW